MAKQRDHEGEIVVIKKYANRRLYNTETSSYVTLEDLRVMVKEGQDFTVCDAKTGADLTRQILTQIIFEQESSEGHILSEQFLKNLILFYGDTISDFMTPYLENSMQTFMKNQSEIRSYVDNAMLGFQPMQQMEEMTRQNMELMNKTFQMFNPFGAQQDEK